MGMVAAKFNDSKEGAVQGKSYCAFCSIKIKARVNLPFILIRTKHKRFLLEKSSIISCVLVCCDLIEKEQTRVHFFSLFCSISIKHSTKRPKF